MLNKTVLGLLTLSFLFLMNCGGGNKVYELKNGRQFEGWAGPPEDPTGSPQEFFYMKYTGRASEKALKKKSGAMMETTCRDAAELNAKGDIIQKLAHETVTGASGVSDGESTGKVVVREFAAQVTGMNTMQCEPLAKAEADIPNSEWKECRCVMYVRIEGGRDSVLAKAKAKMSEN
ncbi:MAG: lipoprotein LipL21 [Leptospiraceae bacterium]|nr:lipoprotein LipL21 [Leptospiraceae bacterium]MCP5498735.1 lipoprotein LipL21 [Leptospiraceae bacterium]